MKKMKKVWMLALLAAGFAMVLGCSNGSSDDEAKDPTPNPDTEQPTDPAGDETPETEPEYLSLGNDWDLGGGYDSSYDGATKTITWSKAYGGRGWWFGSGDNAKDASAYTKFTVVFSNATGEDPWLKLVVEYDADNSEPGEAEGVFNADGFKLTVGLDSSNKSSIKQAYIVGKAEGNTATIKEAYFE